MPETNRRTELVSLSQIKEAVLNPKRHDLDGIKASMTRFGFVEQLVLDERTGRLVAGHGRAEALRALHAAGGAPPDGVVEEGTEWRVPVLRGWGSKDDTEAQAYLLASNRLTEIGGWNDDDLKAMLASMAVLGPAALEGVGFDQDEVEKLLGTGLGGQLGEEDVPEPPETSWVKPGDRFALQGHRLWCGDCTEAATLQALGISPGKVDACWTDPPWNVAYGETKVPGGWSSKHKPIANDNLGEKFPQFAEDFCNAIACVLRPGAPLYMAMSAQEWPVIDGALRKAGFHWSSTIIWAKDSLVLSRKDYHTQYEPVWYGWRDGAPRLVPLEDRTQSDLWPIARPKRSDEHPTMKPVELVERAIINSTRRGNVVFEPFGGSGTTLIACERTERTCCAVELSPSYCQVIIERWEKLTGKKHQKL